MNLKSFREDKLKLKTEREFAELLGVEESDILRWEKDPDSMSFKYIEIILRKTGATLEELTEWKKPTIKPLRVEDTWKAADFTKHTLSDYIDAALESMELPEEYRVAYVEDLRCGIAANLMKPKVAIVGRSDTGKSTLINTLLGAEKMPASWTPTTSVAVYIKHISDRPAFIKEDVWVFANQFGGENLWDVDRLYDENYCRSWKIGAGNIEILRAFGTRQGENYDKEAGAAVVFLDAPVLKTCDIIDLPGFGTETENDDNITFATSQKADIVLYLSQANGFMRIEDITYLQRNISELPVWEKKGENTLKPLSNLFIIASQAHTVNCGNRAQLQTILDTGCTNLQKTLPSEYWVNREKQSGYIYTGNGFQELRSRFFAYTTDIPEICIPFNTALTEILEALPGIINEKTKEYVKDYVKARKPNLLNEIQKYEGIVSEREKYITLLKEIEDNELSRAQDNDQRKKEVQKEISRLASESVEEFSEYIAELVNTDALITLMKKEGVKNKKEEIEQFGSSLQSMVQGRCEAILSKKSEMLSNKAKEYITSYAESIAQPFENNSIAVDFDAGWAFASALSTLGVIGGFGAFLTSTISGALLFAGAGFSIGTSIWAGVVTSSIFGPIGIAAGLLIAGGLGLVKLFGGGWEKSVSKKIVAVFEKNNISENFRNGIRQYWLQTEKAFQQAAEKLDEDWDTYVKNLHDAVNESNISEIEYKINSLRNLSDFFENIPL